MEFIDIVKKMEQENKESEKIISLLKIVSALVDENAKLKYRITEPELLEHGEWIQHIKSTFHYCSKCLEDAPFSRSTQTEMLTDYCPHCGAIMDGENDVSQQERT